MCNQYNPDDPRSQESIDKHRDGWGNLSGYGPEAVAKSLSDAGFKKDDVQHINGLSGTEAGNVSGSMKS